MKKTGFFLLFCIAAARMTFSQGLYDIITIQEIHIVFPQSNWDYLLDSLAALGDEYRLPGTVFVNGQEFDSAGIRYKGNSSYNPDQVKNPLNIKLDDVIDDQTYEGYGTIKLSNGFKDPSLVRETMSYEIARKYMPAPLSNYARVTINDQYIGLYTSNQDVDRYFMTNWFTASDNARLKGEMNGTLPPGQYGVWKYYGTDSSDYFPVFTFESDIGWNELVNFLDTVNNDSPYLEEVLNVDRHLWLLAFENLLVNLDSPINNPQNYYLDKDDAGRFNPVVWDLNETFGVFSNLNGSGPQSLLQLQQMDPFVHVTDVNYPVLNKILTDPLYKRMYVAHMKTMLSENFTNGWYLDRALEIQGIIGAEVQGVEAQLVHGPGAGFAVEPAMPIFEPLGAAFDAAGGRAADAAIHGKGLVVAEGPAAVQRIKPGCVRSRRGSSGRRRQDAQHQPEGCKQSHWQALQFAPWLCRSRLAAIQRGAAARAIIIAVDRKSVV